MSQKFIFLRSIEQSLKRLRPLIEMLKNAKNDTERLKLLNQTQEVTEFLDKRPNLKKHILTCSEFEQYILKSIFVLDQGDLVFQGSDQDSTLESGLKILLDKLKPVEKFYDILGGIIGYHATVLQLILEKAVEDQDEATRTDRECFLKPPGHDLSKDPFFVRKAIKNSLEKMSELAEIYPVGGAGDRLNLHDEQTGESLPAAELLYDGRTLLEGLVRDLQAREYLYYKLFGTQITVPIVMMTSEEKNNDKHILAICEKNNWFERDRNFYEFFKQPLVPVLTEQGDWAVQEPMKLILKPGGHGVLWKLAWDSGVVERLLKNGRKKALIRQINNPIAGIDYGLLAFCGVGFLSGQMFGFSSCLRLLNTAEGVNVLNERKFNGDYEYSITNIEYPDFEKKQIKDCPEKPESSFSLFPANTNILFINLHAIKDLVKKCPVPGMLINMKTKVLCLSRDGKKQEVLAGRLESLMQNLADVMTKHFPRKQERLTPEMLPTFLTYNDRHKTISVTKKQFTIGQPIVETPEGCYYDQLRNHYELFTNCCHMKFPKMVSEEEYVHKGPSFITSFHPALGPLFSIIAQKIQGGSLDFGSEMALEIAEIELRNIEVAGSLLIYAENIMGHKDEQGIIRYSEKHGRCVLKNVKIINRGINREQTKQYWKRQISRHEALKIRLKGESEFIAEDITLEGDMNIEVPEGCRMTARKQGRKITFDIERLSQPKRQWKYFFNAENQICLQ